MESKYGALIDETDQLDDNLLFQDHNAVLHVLNQRKKYKFMRVLDLVKKRASVYGIYALNDKVEMNQLKLMHLKKQLQITVSLMIKNQPEPVKTDDKNQKVVMK